MSTVAAVRLRLRGLPPPVRDRPGEPGEDLRRGGRPGDGGVRHRHRFRHAERTVHQPQGLPQALPALPSPRERLGPPAHAVEDVHPSLRLGDRAAAGHRRRRLRHPQPGAVLRGGHGPADAQGAFRRRRSPSGAAASTPRRRCPSARRTKSAARCASGSRFSAAAAASSSTRSTTCRPRTPPENLLAMYEAVREAR